MYTRERDIHTRTGWESVKEPRPNQDLLNIKKFQGGLEEYVSV